MYVSLLSNKIIKPNPPLFLKLKELKERQKQQLRQKAMKKGLDPE